MTKKLDFQQEIKMIEMLKMVIEHGVQNIDYGVQNIEHDYRNFDNHNQNVEHGSKKNFSAKLI